MKHVLHSLEVKTKAMELRQSGKSFNEIGKLLGIHKNVANYWCKSEEQKDLDRQYKREYHAKWYSDVENKERKHVYAKERRLENWEHVIGIQRQSKVKRKEKVKAKLKYRLLHDVAFRLIERQRGYIKKILKGCGTKKYGRTVELLGCTSEELVKYLEVQFTDGMTWKNHGTYGWHVDHIQPLNVFDLSDPEQQRIAFHYTNLRPLWWRDNLSRSKGFRLEKSK